MATYLTHTSPETPFPTLPDPAWPDPNRPDPTRTEPTRGEPNYLVGGRGLRACSFVTALLRSASSSHDPCSVVC